MAKYIDADALTKTVFKASFWDDRDEDVCYDLIGKMPAADVEPVRHGEWIERPHEIDDTILTFKCSICEHTFFWRCDRCPNCGCKMDGGSE